MVEQALKSAFGPCSVSYAQPRITDMSMILMRLGQLYRSYARCIMQHGHGRCIYMHGSYVLCRACENSAAVLR